MMKFIQLEMKQLIRSKWLQIVTLLFVVTFSSVLIIQQIAMPGAEGFTRQTAAMLNVLLFLLPLFLLTIGSMSLAADRESGWLNLLKTYPMSDGKYITTKWIGLLNVFLLITALAIAISYTIGSFFGGISINGPFMMFVLILLLIFTSLSIFVGVLAKNRLHALALALGVWSVITLILSYVLMAVGTMIPEHVLKTFISLSIHINPLEWLRFGYFVFTGQSAVLGPAFYEIVKFYDSPIGIAYYGLFSALWVFGPLLLATYILKRR